MDRPYSLQDELSRMAAEREAEQRRCEGRAAYQRFLDYQHGQAVASDIIKRHACASGMTYELRARSLRQAAAQQTSGLVGRIAAGELRTAAQHSETEVERQQPQQNADARLLALRERIARQHGAREGAIYRDHDERDREPGR